MHKDFSGRAIMYDFFSNTEFSIEGKSSKMSGSFEGSDEHEDWITETGGRDEDRDYYYQKWFRRTHNIGMGNNDEYDF
jgi:hypothetical protein